MPEDVITQAEQVAQEEWVKTAIIMNLVRIFDSNNLPDEIREDMNNG